MNYSRNIFKMSVQKISLLTVAFVLLFSSCGNETAKKETKKTDPVTEKKEDSTLGKEVEKIIYPLPTPYEIANMLNKAGAGYIFNISNPVENVDKYFTEKSKALNLGIYGADLSYASTYNKSQETQLFLACTKQLTDDLGINSAFNGSVIDRVEANIDNKDSLHTIISESYYDTFEYLNKNGKGSISVMILAGGWVEGMYLSTQLAIITNNDAEIIAGISSQRATLNKLVTILKTYKDDPSIGEVVADLKKIKAVMDTFQDGAAPNAEQLEKFTTVIEEVRSAIVE